MSPSPVPGEPFEELVVAGGDDGRVTVMYPDDFYGWDEASGHISLALDAPVFSFHIHDGDLWMYVLFRNGEEVDHFNAIPDYFEDVGPEERSVWAGDAAIVAEVWPGVKASSVARYLTLWDLDDDAPGKAYEEDEHPYHDCWQLADFMAKLGLPFPLDAGVDDERYRFDVETDV